MTFFQIFGQQLKGLCGLNLPELGSCWWGGAGGGKPLLRYLPPSGSTLWIQLLILKLLKYPGPATLDMCILQEPQKNFKLMKTSSLALRVYFCVIEGAKMGTEEKPTNVQFRKRNYCINCIKHIINIWIIEHVCSM